MKQRTLFLLAAALCVCGLGCSNSTALSHIHADGTIDREVHLSSGDTQARGSKVVETPVGRVFDIQSQRGHFVKSDAGKTVVVKRSQEWMSHQSYGPGANIRGDVRLLDKQQRVEIANEASARPLGDGRWQYVETYRWVGHQLPPHALVSNTLRSKIKLALGGDLDSATIDRIADGSTSIVWQKLFGPGSLLLKPDAKSKFDEAQKREIVGELRRSAVLNGHEAAAPKILDAISAWMDKEDSGLKFKDYLPPTVAMSLLAKTPGKILESNGRIDRDKNEASLQFLSPALLDREVTLRVVYQTDSR